MRHKGGNGTGHLWMLAQVLVVAVAVVALLRPSTRVGGAIIDWWDQAQLRDLVRASWPDLTSTGARVGARGPEALTVVEFVDYQCPACRLVHHQTQTMMDSMPDLEILYRHMPLREIHPHATDAARASVCAQEVGRFAAMHDYLMTTDAWQTDPEWVDVATAIEGIDPVSFIECMTAPRTLERLEKDWNLASLLGVTGTPTFVGRQGMHLGSLKVEDLARLAGSAIQ